MPVGAESMRGLCLGHLCALSVRQRLQPVRSLRESKVTLAMHDRLASKLQSSKDLAFQWFKALASRMLVREKAELLA